MTSIPDLRWQCPRGHFIAGYDIHQEDFLDPGSYYGIGTVVEYVCKGCSKPEDPYMYFDLPRLVEVGQLREAS